MVLNNLPQMFSFYFPSNFWYDEVVKTWTPFVQRMRLPYESVSDFMNSQVQAVVFPTMSLDLSTQQRGQYEVAYYGGKELEPLMDKNLRITMKLTESYLSYWIFWHQMDVFLHYVNNYKSKKPCWMEPINLAFLSDAGFKLTEFVFKEITPISLSDLQLSYAATAAQYNTFSVLMKYNRFEIK